MILFAQTRYSHPCVAGSSCPRECCHMRRKGMHAAMQGERSKAASLEGGCWSPDAAAYLMDMLLDLGRFKVDSQMVRLLAVEADQFWSCAQLEAGMWVH